MRKLFVVLGLLLLTCATRSHAGDRVGIGVKAGTLGIGLDLTARVNNWVSFRGTYSRFDENRHLSESGNDYDGTLKLGAYGVLCDFFPLRGNFRISGGFFKNRNGIELISTPTAAIDVGGTTYLPAEVGTLRGDVKFKSSVPYLGIGYGSAARPGMRVRFVFDFGVLSQGAGDVGLSSSAGLVAPSDLRSEEAQLEDKFKHYKIWPVLAFGISFRI